MKTKNSADQSEEMPISKAYCFIILFVRLDFVAYGLDIPARKEVEGRNLRNSENM